MVGEAVVIDPRTGLHTHLSMSRDLMASLVEFAWATRLDDADGMTLEVPEVYWLTGIVANCRSSRSTSSWVL